MDKKSNVQRKDMKQLFVRSLLTGLIGGLLLGFSWVVFSYFNFVEFNPRTILLHKWISSEWTQGLSGNVITIFLISILSIINSFIYYILFKKINSIWIGVAYGIAVWSILFFIVGQLFPDYKVSKLDKETTISTLSLFTLYGTFIGYSISYDFYRIKADSLLEEDV